VNGPSELYDNSAKAPDSLHSRWSVPFAGRIRFSTQGGAGGDFVGVEIGGDDLSAEREG